MNFKTFLAEANKSIEELEADVDDYIKAGEIVNPQYIDLKWKVDHAIDRESKPIENLAVTDDREKSRTQDMYDIEEALGSLWYDVPDSTNDVLALKNKLARVKTEKGRAHPFYKALEAFYTKYSPLAQKMKDLKGMIVKTAVKRAQTKEREAQELKIKFNDSSSLIEVLTQHLKEYTDRAFKMAGEQYDSNMQDLKEHDWHIDAAAPEPEKLDWRQERHLSRGQRDTRESKIRRRAYLLSLTDPNGKGEDKNKIRKASPEKKKELQEQAEKQAHASYMAWVRKMVEKIGKPVASAKMTGSPWTGSVLHVVCKDGEEQTWNNKMILNRSKYDNLFNQFPSRRAK